MTLAAYRELRAQVQAALGQDHGPSQHAASIEWRLRLFLFLLIGDLLVLLYAPWWWLKVLSASLFALYRARTIWTIIHDRVHRAVDVPLSLPRVVYDMTTVFVVRFWRAHHLQHHAHTNTELDPDTRMFFGRDLAVVREPAPMRQVGRFASTLAQYPFLFFLFLYRSLAAYRGGRFGLYTSGVVAYALFLSLLLPHDEATLNTAANFGLGGLYILFTFAPTHAAGAHNFKLGDSPFANQIIATNNVWPRSRLWTFLCSGINLHVEHHLFPDLPWHSLSRVAPLVEAHAAKHGLPYQAYSPLGLWRRHLRFIWES